MPNPILTPCMRAMRVLLAATCLLGAAAHAQTTAFPASSSVTAKGRDVLIDFGGTTGVWGYAGAARTWRQLTPGPITNAVRADMDGNGKADTVIDLGPGKGLWSLLDSGQWRLIHGGSASWVVAGDLNGSGRDDLAIDFGPGYGIWLHADGSSWTNLHTGSARSAITADLDHNGRLDLVADFGEPYGIWVWLNGAGWEYVHGGSAKWMVRADLDRNRQDDLVIDFGPPYGIWAFRNRTSWAQLHTASAKSGAAADLGGSGFADSLLIDFSDPYGIWRYSQAGGWRQVHATAKGMLVADNDGNARDDVIVDFGSQYGIWRWANSSTWSQLHVGTGNHMAAFSMPAVAATSGPPTIGGCPMFLDKAIFNLRIDDAARFPVHARSSAWIGSIGATRRFHADWGTNDNPQQFADYYGIPYNIVDGTTATTAWPQISLDNGYPDESDCAQSQSGGGHAIRRGCDTLAAAERRFPYPLDSLIKIEGGACNDPSSCGDRHVLVVEQGTCRLWESWFNYKSGGVWTAGSSAAWTLGSYEQRPDTWTSSDAAGLPILPLLARVGEATTGEVRHALRVTFLDSVLAREHVWPARHDAGGATTGGIPFGALLRLRANFVIPTTWTAQAQALARAMQRYGLYVADIGSNLYVQGEPSAQWNDLTISQLQTLQMSQFEFVDISAVTSDARFNAGSLQGAW